MCDRHNQTDVSHTLTTHFLLRHFYTTTLAHNAFILDAFVLAAMALIVLGRTKDTLAEQTVTLGFVGAVVDCFGLEYLAA